MLIVDTGVLVAVGDEADRYYRPCRDLLETDLGPLVTNALVVAETAYMLRRGLGGVAELALLEMIRDGTLIVVNLLPEDWDRVAELVERYDDLGLGVTDASVIAMAERLGARVWARGHAASLRFEQVAGARGVRDRCWRRRRGRSSAAGPDVAWAD